MNTRFVQLGILVLSLALLAPSALGQFYFGRNKVQYTEFEWQVMTTEHFNIYFYAAETEVAQIGARIAEDAYPRLAAKFNLEIERKIPLIIYSSPGFFSQTNVVPGLLPESVGGFTEFLKGRVVLPFHGSYFDFEHVIVHELVHVFMIAKLDTELSRRSVYRGSAPPLWFTEGIAEYWSEEWDNEADMIMKDLVLSGQIIPITDFWKVHGTYFMYKLGQSVCRFITERYGEDKLYRLFENWTKGRNFNDVVRWTIGLSLEQLSREWIYWLKKQYYPEIESSGLPKREATQITFDGYAVKGVPISWDDGDGEQDYLIYMAYRRGYTGIYMKPRNGGKDGRQTLVKGERSSRFESLHLLRTGIDATNSGLVAFSSKSKAQDVIYIFSLREKRVVAEHRFEQLVAMRSPRFSPDERYLVFSGIRKSGYTDLYLLNLVSGDLTTLTRDHYNDIDPAFTVDGKSVVFASNRGYDGDKGVTNLFQLALDRPEEIRQLTWGDYQDQTPDVNERGVFFGSDRGGSYNIYLLEPSGRLTCQSQFATGAFDPRMTPDGKSLTFSGYQDTQFKQFQMPLTDRPEAVDNLAALGHSAWKPAKIDERFSASSVKYETDYSFDIAQSSIAYDPIYGSAGGLQASFSDILGNHAIYFLLTNSAETKDEFLESFNIGATYVNRSRRLNWGFGGFHLYDEYYNDRDQYFFERQAGGLGFLSYPVSKFQRVELASYLRYDKKDRRFGLKDREGFLASTFVSWVYDNAIWDISGPIEGRRYILSAGITQSLSHGQAWNRIGFADLRHYLRIGQASALANRIFAFQSGGLEPQRIYFGGSWNFRGFDRRHFYERKVLFTSTELRFPLIDNLSIGFPFGAIGFRAIRGALFVDIGSAWDDQFDQFYGSYGWGFRVNLGYVVLLRFDFARTTDFKETSPNFDFDFFFGWNF